MILFIWDFHGVLEKDNEIALAEQLNFILEKYGFGKRVSVAEALALSGRHYRQIFFDLCPGITVEQAREMGNFAVSTGIEFARRYVKPREHAIEVLRKIKERGNINVVASNTAPKALKEYLKMTSLEEYVDVLFPVVCEHVDPESFSIHDYKLEKIRKFIKDEKFEKIKCVGDNEWDVEFGLKLGAETYLFVPNKLKLKTKAHHIISDLREVLK